MNRYCDLMNTIFIPDSVVAKVHETRDELQPEMARQFARWDQGPITIFGMWDVGRSTDVASWLNEIDTLEEFVNCRPYSVRDSLQAEFSLTKQVDVGLDIFPAGAGKIHLNTIDPEPFPWTGVYMDGVPVTMTATANPGYVFSHWQSPTLITTPNTNASITMNVPNNELFTAHFTQLSPAVNSLESIVSLDVFPNPFSDNFTLKYTLMSDAHISVKLFDVLGQEISRLVSPDRVEKPGNYELKVDAKEYALPAGIYFLNFSAEGQSKMTKLIKTEN